MGTRAIYGFKKGDTLKVTYNHYDGYPSFLGNNLVQEIKGVSLDVLNAAFDRIVLVDEEVDATQEQIAECAQFGDTSVSMGTLTDWYCLLRNTQGKLAPYLNGQLRYMIDYASAFTTGHTDCNYAYIVDLDQQKFQVYFHEGQRFERIGSFDLANLPSHLEDEVEHGY